MESSGSVFSETLQEITNTKLDELAKRRNSFEESKASVLATLQNESNAITRLHTLSAGTKRCFGIKVDRSGKVVGQHTAFPRVETQLKNLDRFLSQAKYDPSLSAKMLAAWEQTLVDHLDTQSLKLQYASLYGQLVTEWLSGDVKAEPAASDDVQMGEAFEDLGSAQMLQAREAWEESVFEPANVDEAALSKYLASLFGVGDANKKPVRHALDELRKSVYDFETSLSGPNQFNVTSLKWVIQGLHSSDLLSDEKREVLKDFEGNEILLREIADVLNMRMVALDSWVWSSDSSVPVEMRRKISGIYSIHMHEDLLQAIFLHYIGVKWSVFFKQAFKTFHRAKDAWATKKRDVTPQEWQRYSYYLGQKPVWISSYQVARTKVYNEKYFMSQLKNRDEQQTVTVEGEEEADYAMAAPGSLKRRGRPLQAAQSRVMRFRGPPPTRSQARDASYNEDLIDYSDEDLDNIDGEDSGEAPSPMELKQTVLHLLSTELTINKRLYGDFTAFHSVFESWNPLLPHETVRTVLKFLGISETWLGFFTKFLEAPLKFTDDNSTPPRKRRRGTPGSHTLSDVFGETALFCLDFAVNQTTGGDILWRINDDMWFWSRDHEVVAKAWKTVEQFRTVTGTQINPAKTGTVRVSAKPGTLSPIDKSLPGGEIRWGFLRLSPETGHFEIDQNMVTSHINELRDQLKSKSNSVLGFIHAWNQFAGTFFASNFGKPANCFGRKHVDSMLSTHERIQRQVFASFAGDEEGSLSSVAEYLKETIAHRFGITNIPDGFLYFPTEIGGLELQSSFISLLQIRDGVHESPDNLLSDFEANEVAAYEKYRTAFQTRVKQHQPSAGGQQGWVPDKDPEVFFPFEEYIRFREYSSFDMHAAGTRLTDVFSDLLKRPTESSIDQDYGGQVCNSLGQLAGSNLQAITRSWGMMSPYWRWVAMMYGPEVLERFGSLNIVDPGLLPMGMVSFFKEKRVQW
jgi:hypothetical protein